MIKDLIVFTQIIDSIKSMVYNFKNTFIHTNIDTQYWLLFMNKTVTFPLVSIVLHIACIFVTCISKQRTWIFSRQGWILLNEKRYFYAGLMMLKN